MAGPEQPILIPTESASVVLRQLTPADAPAYFDAVDNNRDHLSQFGDTTATKYPDPASVERSIASPDNPNKLRFGIWDGDAFVGSINLTPEEDSSAAEIGYWLDRRHTGQGYATVATRALAAYARERYPRVYAEVVDGNAKSADVLRRAGFAQASKKTGKLIFELLAPQERSDTT